MSDDLNLEIILSAVNQTGSPIKEMTDSLLSFQTSIKDLSTVFTDSFTSMTSTINSFASNIQSSMKDDSAALADFGKSMDTAATDVAKDMQSSAKAVTEFEKTASSDLTLASESMNTLRTNMNKGIDQIGGLIAIQMLGQSMEHLGQQGEKLFDYAIDQGADMQQTMKNVQTVIAVNSDGQGDWNSKLRDAAGLTDQLQQKALTLGSRGAQSANEIGTAMDAMLRGGVDPAAVLNGAAQAAQNVAIVTGDKLSDSADLMTNTYHEFRSEFEKNGKSVQQNMTDAGNVISGVLLSAKISSTEFGDTFKYVAPLAAQMGSSLLDTATATAVLARNGIDGSQAGTNLKRVFTSLLAPTKAGTAALTELGIIQNGHNTMIDESTGKLKSLTEMQAILSKSTEGLTEVKKAQLEKELFGQYALTGSLVLINQTTSEYGKLKEKIGNVDAEKAAASMLDTFSGHMAQLHAHVATTAKEFGMAFLPVLEKLLPIGQKVLDWLQSLSPQTKEFGMGLLAAGSAIAIVGGGLAAFAISAKFAGEGMKALKDLFMIQAEGEAAVSVFKALATSIRTVGIAETFMNLMNPMAWIALAVAAVIGLAIVITQHWGQISEWLKEHFGITIPGIFKAFGEIFDKVWNGIKAIFKDTWDYIQPTITAGVKAISDYWNDVWPKIQKVFTEVWGVIKAVLTPALVLIKFEISTAIDIIKSVWHDAWNMIKDVFKLVWDLISSDIQTGWDLISGIFNLALDLLTGNWKGAWNDIKATFTKVWDDIKITIGNLVNDALDFGKNFVKMIADGITSGIKDVENAAKAVVGKIKSFLGFHSPTEEGPGSDADQWAPNFVKMFAGGLAAGASDVAGAAQSMMSPLSDALNSLGGVSNSGPADNAVYQQKKNVDAMEEGVTAIINAKNAYAKASQMNDKAAMDSAHKAADSIRAKMQQMGMDTTQFAANKSVPEAMKGMQDIIKSVTDSVSAKYKTMTTDLTQNITDVSTQTTSNTDLMANAWATTTDKVTDSSKALQKMLTEVFQSIENMVKAVAMSMENAMASSFQGIVNTAQNASAAVVSAVNQMKAAMASVTDGGMSVSSSMSTSSTMSFAGMPMATLMSPVTSSRSGGNVYHMPITVSGNIAASEDHLANIVQKKILDSMKGQGKV